MCGCFSHQSHSRCYVICRHAFEQLYLLHTALAKVAPHQLPHINAVQQVVDAINRGMPDHSVPDQLCFCWSSTVSSVMRLLFGTVFKRLAIEVIRFV
jgi:hypothetical protein